MSEIILARRVQNIKPSATLAVAALAGRLKAEGKSIVSLATGEPDFDTPEHIKQAGIKAIEAGFTKYTAADGITELRQAVVDKLKRENHLSYTLPQVMITAGAKDGLFNMAQALLNPGDEVIIPAPYWVSYPDIVLLADAVPVIVTTTFENHYKITPEQLEKAITPKTRLFIMNSPANPSGQVYTPDEMQALGDVLRRHPNVWIASDDIYEAMVWGESQASMFKNILSICGDLHDRTVVLNSASKTYAMTGWRIGYSAGPQKLIAAMASIQSQSISNPVSMAQKAALAALTGDQQPVRDMVAAYQERHTYLYGALSQIPGIRVLPAQGTFYLFPDIRELIKAKNLADDVEFAEKLLTDVGLALVPGTAFGMPGCIRFAFTVNLENLKEAVRRLQQFCMSS